MKCPHCGSLVPHEGKCHLIKAVEYHENGTIKRVEYMTPADYIQHANIFPHLRPPDPNLTFVPIPWAVGDDPNAPKTT
jgi:hypothetical protein